LSTTSKHLIGPWIGLFSVWVIFAHIWKDVALYRLWFFWKKKKHILVLCNCLGWKRIWRSYEIESDKHCSKHGILVGDFLKRVKCNSSLMRASNTLGTEGHRNDTLYRKDMKIFCQWNHNWRTETGKHTILEHINIPNLSAITEHENASLTYGSSRLWSL